MSKFFQFLKSRTLLVNIIIFIVVIVAGFFILTSMLNTYTHHGENIPVPDLRGKKVSNLNSFLAEHNFNYKIVDSLYDGSKKPGTVLDQDPAPSSKVKKNRMLYLTINAIQPPDVKMPDLVDVSYRQAEAMLESFGLVTGEIIYKSDLAKNAVLEQRYKDRIIKPGTVIPKGSAIDLVLGDGLGDFEISIPDLTGMTRKQALATLRKANLHLGSVHYDTSDTLRARVYKQIPEADMGFAKQGDDVSIYLE